MSVLAQQKIVGCCYLGRNAKKRDDFCSSSTCRATEERSKKCTFAPATAPSFLPEGSSRGECTYLLLCGCPSGRVNYPCRVRAPHVTRTVKLGPGMFTCICYVTGRISGTSTCYSCSICSCLSILPLYEKVLVEAVVLPYTLHATYQCQVCCSGSVLRGAPFGTRCSHRFSLIFTRSAPT